MKKILFIMMASFVFLMALPFSSVFAESAGIMRGKQMNYGTDNYTINVNKKTMNITDGNETSALYVYGESASADDVFWYEFDTEISASEVYLKADTGSYEIQFFSSNGTLINSAIHQGNGTRLQTSGTVRNIKKVAIQSKNISPQKIYEFDLFGTVNTTSPTASESLIYGIPSGSITKMTDGDLSSYQPLNGNNNFAFTLNEVSKINSLGFAFGSNMRMTIEYLGSTGNLLRMEYVQLTTSPTVKNYTIEPISGVKQIRITAGESYSYPLYEFEVYGERPPPPPVIIHDSITKLTETHTYNAANLTWENPINNEAFTGTIVKKDGVQVADLSKNISSYNATGLEAEEIYTFEVIAKYSDSINSAAKSITVKTNAPEKAGEIIELTATAEPERVDLSWKLPGSEKFKHINIYRDQLTEISMIDKILGATVVSAAAENKIFETNGTYFNDLTVEPSTTYEYTLKTISTEGAESEGVTTVIKTPEPQIEGAGYTKELETGDFIYYWDKPTTGEVKIMLGGSSYKTVSAATKEILIPKNEMKYTPFGDPDVSLIPIASNGVEGTPEKPSLNGEGSADSIANAKIPFSAKDLLNSGLGLLLIISPFVLLALSFLVVPKLRRILFAAFSKKSSPEERKRRFNDDGTPKETKERKEQRERKEKAEQEKRERKERTEREKQEQRERKERTEREKRLAKGYEKEKPLLVEKAPRFAKEPRARREKVGRSERQQRPQRERSTRERKARTERG